MRWFPVVFLKLLVGDQSTKVIYVYTTSALRIGVIYAIRREM